jgi:hypothetical protein
VCALEADAHNISAPIKKLSCRLLQKELSLIMTSAFSNTFEKLLPFKINYKFVNNIFKSYNFINFNLEKLFSIQL